MRLAPAYRARCWLGWHPIHVTFTFHLGTTVSAVAVCRCGSRVESS